MLTFMYVSKNMVFWSNVTLDSKQELITTRLDTKEVEISMSCQQMHNQVMAYDSSRGDLDPYPDLDSTGYPMDMVDSVGSLSPDTVGI